MLRMLEVRGSGFYDWRGRQQQPSSRQQEDTNLSQRIRHIHARSRGRYGMPRVHAELREEGVRVSRKRVAGLQLEWGSPEKRVKITAVPLARRGQR
jgi:putative transposase